MGEAAALLEFPWAERNVSMVLASGTPERVSELERELASEHRGFLKVPAPGLLSEGKTKEVLLVHTRDRKRCT